MPTSITASILYNLVACPHRVTMDAFADLAERDPHPSSAASIEWYDRWTTQREPKLKERILAYNEDDCRATRVLLDAIRGLSVPVG
ncbi:MAG: ribonuclease H-like domain-containing protein [Gammaproteobacteria bacterium]